MSTDNMSKLFDVLYNNITSNQAPGLNDYEKSWFLTKAQNQLLLEYFNHRTDFSNGGFDRSEKRQIDFSPLISTARLSSIPATANTVKIDHRSILFQFGKQPNMLSIINEFVSMTDRNGNVTTFTVIPISYDEYSELMKKPYKYPVKGCVWRLLNTDSVSSQPFTEIIGNSIDNSAEYIVRYVRKPKPIVLLDLTGTMYDIEGTYTVTPCELPEEAQHDIVERAVTLAKIAWQGSTSTLVNVAAASKKE